MTHDFLQVIRESYVSHTRVINCDAFSSGKQRIKWRIPKQLKEEWEQMLPSGRRGKAHYEYGFTRAVKANNLTAGFFHQVKKSCLIWWGKEKYLQKLRDVGLCEEESAFYGRGYDGDIESNKVKLVEEMCGYYHRKFPRSSTEPRTSKHPARPPPFR